MDAVTASTSAPDIQPSRRAETAAASMVFAVSCILILGATILTQVEGPADVLSVALLYVLLMGGCIGLGVADARHRLQKAFRGQVRLLLGGPVVLLVAVLLYARLAELPVLPRAVAYAAYLLGPVTIVILQEQLRRAPVLFWLGAALAFWLPIEFDLLPSLPLPAPDGYDASRFLGIVGALYLFLVARPLDGVGYTFRLTRDDLRWAGSALAVFAVVALPFGFLTAFLTWQPQLDAGNIVVVPLVIYLVTAVPEEFLFRGLIQNLITRRWGPRVGLGVAAVVFGLAHLPDPRYVVLATVAGLAYGWVYARTGKVTASALTHTGVNWLWALFLSYP